MTYLAYEERMAMNKIKREKRRQQRIRKARMMRLGLAVIVMLMLVMTASVMLRPAAAEINPAKENYPSYVVQQDDTLWDIAKKYTDNRKDVRETIYEISELNGIDAADSLKVGDTLYIPVN